MTNIAVTNMKKTAGKSARQIQPPHLLPDKTCHTLFRYVFKSLAASPVSPNTKLENSGSVVALHPESLCKNTDSFCDKAYIRSNFEPNCPDGLESVWIW